VPPDSRRDRSGCAIPELSFRVGDKSMQLAEGFPEREDRLAGLTPGEAVRILTQ